MGRTSIIQDLPLGRSEALLAAFIRVNVEKQGLLIEPYDIPIAATAAWKEKECRGRSSFMEERRWFWFYRPGQVRQRRSSSSEAILSGRINL